MIQNLVLWGVIILLCPPYCFLALCLISLIDKRVTIPAWMDKVLEFFFFDLSLLAPIAIFIIDACIFGLLNGLMILLIQMVAAFAVGVAFLWAMIIFLQIETATVKVQEAVKIFWNKQYRLL